MHKKSFIFASFFILVFAKCFSQEQNNTLQNQNNSINIESMLANYISQDSTIKSLALEYQQAVLSKKEVKNQQSFNIKLSTGNIFVNSNVFSLSPSIEFIFPQLNGTTIKTSIPLDFSNKEQNTNLNGFNIGVETEIWGSTRPKQILQNKKANRSVLLAQRTLKNQILNIEIEFYKSLKSIYSDYSSLLSSENSLYEEKINLELLQTQGYSKNSSKYRIAQLEFGDIQRDVDQKKHTLNQSIVEFSEKCGLENPLDLSFLQTINFPNEKEDSDSMFTLENYIDVEQSKWNLDILQEEINTNKPFTVSFGANYTYLDEKHNADVVSTALNLSGFGTNLSVGILFPITGVQKTPEAQLLLSWNPLELKSKKIQKEKSNLEIENALLKYENAKTSYNDLIKEANLTKGNLLWQKQTNLKELDLYKELANDMELWFKQGYVTDSENRMTQTKLKNAEIQCRINDIDILLNKLEMQIQFITED